MNGQEEMTAARGGVLVELSLGDAAADFNLEKAVCSHGLFMMAPNRWDSQSKTLLRPLRLHNNDDPPNDKDQTSFMVHISQSPQALLLRVLDAPSLSPSQHKSLLSQVSRMLRLSEEENKKLKEFHKVHEEAKGRGFGRMFRSPTLFEDMIKCILLCNCQWSRTLSMAQALCELQSELQQPSSSASMVNSENGTISKCQTTKTEQFVPKTPAGKESKKKSSISKCSRNLANKYAEFSAKEETDLRNSNTKMSSESSQETEKLYNPNSNSVPQLSSMKTGNFPSPKELASLDEKFLAKRCNLGYRAGRVINLAQEVVEGRIQLSDFEYPGGSSDYDKLFEKLRMINGFGPFTCANVLMCIGFYHVIPTDSETIRHLKQVHAKASTIRTVQGDVEAIYGKYAPFQFLAYWSELWRFYEEKFGNLSEMPHSSHKLITAANMRTKMDPSRKKLVTAEDKRPRTNRQSKRTKVSPDNMLKDC